MSGALVPECPTSTEAILDLENDGARSEPIPQQQLTAWLGDG
ncbi:hypothetical protein NHJ13734_002571 [Beauveria thailandica]